MGKFLLPLFLISSMTWALGGNSGPLPSGSFDCRVESVGKGVFEEELGAFGDSRFDSDSQVVKFPNAAAAHPFEVRVGQKRLNESDGHKVERRLTSKAMTYDVEYKDGSFRLQFKYHIESRRGVVLYADPAKKWEVLAVYDCADVKSVERAEIGEKNVIQIKGSTLSALNPRVRNRLDEVDFAYEMGDGYYDIRELKYYKVFDPTRKELAGFIVWARLYYTEDKNYVSALVRFDRNGLRMSPQIETLGSCDAPLL